MGVTELPFFFFTGEGLECARSLFVPVEYWLVYIIIVLLFLFSQNYSVFFHAEYHLEYTQKLLSSLSLCVFSVPFKSKKIQLITIL